MDVRDLAVVAPTGLSSIIYATVQCAFLLSLLRRRAPPPLPEGAPRVSIVKPIAGLDDDLAGNLGSFASLDYPDYEILFGIASPDDPAVPVVRSFIAAHPTLKAELVWTDPDAALNPKVAQLIGLTRRCRGSVIVVSDSNIRVPPGYLRDTIAALLRPGVGLVSSLIAGTGERSFGALLENAQLGAFIAPTVLAAKTLIDRSITVGKSMAMRASDLARVGGWESVAGVLAEDDVMGQRFADHGYLVEVSPWPIENRNIGGSLKRTFERHTRWAKMRRSIAPCSFALEPLLSPVLFAAAALALRPSEITLRACLFACALQCMSALLAHGLLRPGSSSWLLAVVEPLRSLVALACWARACVSRRVEWRGNPFYIARGSEVIPVRAEAGEERCSSAQV